MDEQKLITRYSQSFRTSGIASGVYFAASNGTHTAKFNLTIIGIGVNFIAFDDVTNALIPSTVRVSFAVPGLTGHDDPAILNDRQGTELIAVRSGFSAVMPTYWQVSASAVITTTVSVNLEIVTANIITFDVHWYFKYLVPEDYLSVEAFAAKP